MLLIGIRLHSLIYVPVTCDYERLIYWNFIKFSCGSSVSVLLSVCFLGKPIHADITNLVKVNCHSAISDL